jgi:uncharacterized protein (DUF433 family)
VPAKDVEVGEEAAEVKSAIIFRSQNKSLPRACKAEERRMDYQNIITIEPGKRGGRPCIRHLRIAVVDVLGWLAAGMSHDQIRGDYPELTEEDIRACLAYAADRERRLLTAAK